LIDGIEKEHTSTALFSLPGGSKMSNELTNSLKTVAEKVAGYVGEAAKLTVVTQYVEIGANAVDFKESHPAAQTVIQLDGDCASVVPMRRAASGNLEVDADLFSLHERNVATAIDYRTRMMDALLSTFKDAVGR
jgi:hypothetical protein